MKKMKGVVVALTTPFKENGLIDLDTLEKSIDFLCNKGISYLYPCGTTGEMLLLSEKERRAYTEIVVKASAGRAEVFVQCGAADFEETKRLVDQAREIGAAGIGVVTPAFFTLCEEELFTFYSEISKEAGEDFPIYLYNIPQCSGNDISASLCYKLADECSNIVGIKYSYNDAGRISSYLAARNYDFSVLVGLECHVLPYLALGCDGVVSGCANAFPEIFLDLYEAYLGGDLEKAKTLQRRVDRLVHALTINKSMARVKLAQKWRGMGEGHMRRPLLMLNKEEEAGLRTLLEEFL